MVTRKDERYSGYEEIAESWYRLRHRTRFKKELDDIAARWGSGKLLNIGCAHGPDFLPFKGAFELYGVDSSIQMMKQALRYASKYEFNPHLVTADALSLPFADHVFDHAISIAAYHHIEGKSRRERAFAELRRVLKPGGEAFITVWNRWQKQFWNRGKEVMVPWHTDNRTVQRYYYLFTYPEITGLLKKSGFSILKVFPEYGYRFPVKLFSRNICILARSD